MTNLSACGKERWGAVGECIGSPVVVATEIDPDVRALRGGLGFGKEAERIFLVEEGEAVNLSAEFVGDVEEGCFGG